MTSGSRAVSVGEMADAALIARARDDVDAFAELFRRHVDDIHRFVRRRTGDDGLADDLTAVTFERCWRSLDGFRPRHDSLRPWLMRIAANEIASHYRSESRRRAREELVERRQRPLMRHDDVLALDDGELRTALAGLAERHQAVLSLRYLADLTTEEAARSMNMSRNHFAVTQRRALAALRKALQPGGDDARS